MLGDWLNSNAMRCVGYAVAGLACLHAGLRERSDRARRDPNVWPAFWFVTAILLFAMALGRVLDIDEFVTGFGRGRARSSGWYGDRRLLQVAMVGAVAAIGTIVAYRTIGRIIERRRRYLATTLAVTGLAFFAALRFVSLHSIDTVLYHRSIASIHVATVIELGLVALAIVTTYWHPSPRWQRKAPSVSAGGRHDVTRRS